jgi:hypothetical protein
VQALIRKSYDPRIIDNSQAQAAIKTAIRARSGPVGGPLDQAIMAQIEPTTVPDFPIPEDVQTLVEKLSDPRIQNNSQAQAAIKTAIRARARPGDDPLYQAIMAQLTK